jgi:hypothetical protein
MPLSRGIEMSRNDHIGPGVNCEIDEGAAIAGGADNFAPWLKQTPEGVQQHRVVVGKQDAGTAIHWEGSLSEGIDFRRDS